MKILVVEDDDHSRKYLYNLLKIKHYNCEVAKDGLEGLDKFETFEPDIVLSDIRMPVMDGLELLEAIRNKRSDTIFIITTAFGTEEYAIRALELGANNYIKKPILSKDLLFLLEKYKGIIYSRTKSKEIPGMIRNRQCTIEFQSDINMIPRIVDQLLNETASVFDDVERTNIEIGLVELLTNAVEHGNLKITGSEKNKALENGTLDDLYAQRLNDETLFNRQVSIDFQLASNYCEWLIKDEGDGFDWKTINNPTEEENIMELNGRGIFISKFQFDELEFFDKGNVVRARKYYTPR